MYKYETHLHTYPVSACAKADVRECLECYKEMGYDGVFVTHHFLDGNINIEPSRPYEERIEFYFSDYETALTVGKELGIKVLLGIEMSYRGTDFLVYGLDKQWFLENPQIMKMDVKEKLSHIRRCGGFVAQAHPYREASYIDHIRLYPRSVDAVEVINAGRTEAENKMAELYAENYCLLRIAGSDNHRGKGQSAFAGIATEVPINSEQDYIRMIKEGSTHLFTFKK